MGDTKPVLLRPPTWLADRMAELAADAGQSRQEWMLAALTAAAVADEAEALRRELEAQAPDPDQEALELEGLDLLEEGRALASQREDLVAAGVDPALLAVPLAPRA